MAKIRKEFIEDYISPATQLELNKTRKVLFHTATPSTAITGTTTITQAGSSILIPANTFSANDFMNLEHLGVLKTGTAGTLFYRLLHNTTDNFATASVIATAFMDSVNTNSSMLRHFEINGGLLKCRLGGTTAGYTDKMQTNTNLSIAFNPAIANYFFTSVTLSNATDSVVRTQLLITK